MGLVLHQTGSDGPAVVLIHGIPGSSGVWRDVEQALAPDHRVLVADLLGFGQSSRPAGAEELWAERQAEALAAALDAAGVTDACIVGHDFGGPVALALSRRRPELFRSLGLLATNAFPDTPVPLPIRAVRWPLIGHVAGGALFSRPSLALMLRQGSSTPLNTDVYLGDSAQRSAIATIFSHALRNLAELYAPLGEALAEIDVPVLVGWGDRDPFFPVEQGERTAAAARQGRLVVYPGAGHFLPSERPGQVAGDIRALADA
ncbi:MAG TPA: alpha/beta hydrolase [Thermoleophilaceae bacterium]|nr:alpha/beta hydrolase [Thermoleophilaceae bacterium]